MKKVVADSYISDELIAAYLDGNATAQELQLILDAMAKDSALRELLDISRKVDCELGRMDLSIETLPLAAMAATAGEKNICGVECERYILHRRGVEFVDDELLQRAVEHGWLRDKGTALHNIGRNAEHYGLNVARRFKASIEDIKRALSLGDDVIVAIDGGELSPSLQASELLEDIIDGERPDHTVVILGYNAERGTVTLYDPNSDKPCEEHTLNMFLDAWEDSKCYMVTITDRDEYVPCPADLSDVELGDELIDLREAIAENAHEVWAAKRKAEGWSYGPERNDNLKQTPDMVPYAKLPEKEKEYDRQMAMDTIKLLKKLGYDLVKREK